MKLLQVLAEDTLGGTELHAVMVAHRLRQDAAFETAIVTCTPPGPIHRLASDDGTPCSTVSARSWPLRVARLARFLRRECFDVIEAYGAKASTAARFANVLAGRPSSVIVGVQGLHLTEALEPGALKERIARAIERGSQGAVDAYDVNSLQAIDTLVACGVSASRIRYIPNGVDTDYWAPASTPIGDRAAIVVCAARLVPRKRQRDLIEAFSASGLASTGAQLFLVGDGPERPRIEQQVRDTGLEKAVMVCGVLAHRELRDLYHRAVAAVLPSSWEGMPASILEAQACGLSVIGSNVNGTRDVVAHRRTGLVYDLGDIEALRDDLLTVLEDRPLATRMGVAARQAVIKDHSLDGLVRSKTALYESVRSHRASVSGTAEPTPADPSSATAARGTPPSWRG